jgi:hypothetical protein
MKLIYDIMPPEEKKEKIEGRREEKFLRIVSLLLILGVVFNWAGFSGVIGTMSYMSDTESSLNNSFTAGSLDFVLGSPNDFMPSPLAPGESAHREINFLNQANYPKYQVKADGFIGELCDDLILEYSLDNAASASMNLIGFVSGIVDFVEPDVWSFKLTLPASAPESTQGQTCKFKFVFFGSQIKNNLPFGTGFNDIEEINSSIAAESCEIFEIRSHGYWKEHPEVFADHLPQNLGNYVVDTSTAANAVFVECGGDNMSDKLRCQLLAMKFNIAHFGIGDYWVESEGKTIDEIVAWADDLLTPPYGSHGEMEDVKDLLDYLNNLGHVKICGMGGEEPMLVINKVYYDVDNKHGVEGDNELIELYNPSRRPIDIINWIIRDNFASDVLISGTPIIIPGFGFALITGDSSTFDYWDIPADMIKIVLADGEIGNGLANNGDRVILKSPATAEKPDGIEVDKMSYGTDDSGFYPLPPCPDVLEGHMLGRSPNGFDTDLASDWKDFGLPLIHVDYPNGGEVWYVGRTYILRWTATNPSGIDADIIIDLYYSADSGATWGNIVRATENDGEYSWRVPLYIGHVGTGYYVPSARGRIKAVARNVNNFVVSDWDMTDSDFCPPIDYSLLTPEEAAYLMSLEYLGNGESGTAEEVVNVVENFVGDLFEQESGIMNEESGIVNNEPEDIIITEPEQSVQPEEIIPAEPTQNPEIIEAGEESVIEQVIEEQMSVFTENPLEQIIEPAESSENIQAGGEPVIEQTPVEQPTEPTQSPEGIEAGGESLVEEPVIEEIPIEVPTEAPSELDI